MRPSKNARTLSLVLSIAAIQHQPFSRSCLKHSLDPFSPPSVGDVISLGAGQPAAEPPRTPQTRVRTLLGFRKKAKCWSLSLSLSMVCRPLAPQANRSTASACFDRDRPVVTVRLCQLTTNFELLYPFFSSLILSFSSPRSTTARLCQANWQNSVTTNILIRSLISHHEYRAPSIWQVEEEGRRPGRCRHAPQRIRGCR